MEASELVPALRPVLHPAARVLLLMSDADSDGAARGKTASPLHGIGEVARECGFAVEALSHPATIGEQMPEVVLFDGAALLHPGASAKAKTNGSAPAPTGAPTLDTLRELRVMPTLDTVTFIAVVSARESSKDLALLQEAGAGGFLSLNASALEVISRIQSAVELCRARTEIAELRAHITRGLRIDEATGVMTRRYFFQQAHRECARARRYGHPLSCLMVEIDHYRMLCARFSDATGESILRTVATTIGQWTRDSDIIARFAESKFVVLLPETDIEGATAAREKLLSALAGHPWRCDDEEMPVSVSVGEAQLERIQVFRLGAADLSESDDMGETALSTREAMAGLLEDADAALSIARKGARVPEMFVPQMRVEDEAPILGSSE